MSGKVSHLGGGSQVWLLVLVVLLGFALRVHDLDRQSMWSDEGLSLFRAQQPASLILANVITVDGIDTHDTNPPAYFLLLSLFRATVGESVFSLRFAGALAATLAVPLMYALGYLAFGRRAGLVAALLMAISPFHVWQSQVMRNYGLLVSLNLLSVYGLSRFILTPAGRRRWLWLALWAAAGLLGIYSHYFGFFVFAFGAAALIISLITERGIGHLLRQRRIWLALGLSLLIIVPAIFIAYDRFAAGNQVDFYFVPLPTIMHHAASAFSAGMEPSLIQPWWRVIPALLLAAVGLFYGWRTRSQAAALLLGYQFVPLGILFALSFVNPLYNGTRHLLIGLPPFLVFIARGVVGPWKSPGGGPLIVADRLWRWVGPILGIVVIVSQVNWLFMQFNSPRLVRDDIRGAAEYLSAHAGSDEIIILHDTLIQFTFDHYYDGLAPVEAIPSFDQLNVDSAIASLRAAAEGKGRIWFLADPRPRNGLDREALIDWAAENWLPASAQSFPHMWLTVGLVSYVPDPLVAGLPASASPVDVTWENGLKLHGYDGSELITPGADLYDRLLTLLYFSSAGPIAEPFTISWDLVDSEGVSWVYQEETLHPDALPQAGGVDRIAGLARQLDIPYGLPPGEYALSMRLRQANDGRSLVTAGGESEIRLSNVSVTSSACTPDPDLPIRLGDEIELHGGGTLPGEVAAGQTISLRFWWCAVRMPAVDYRLRLQMVDEAGDVVDEIITPLTRSDLPPTAWQASELIIGQTELKVSEWAAGGRHDVRLSFLSPDSEQSLPMGGQEDEAFVSLGEVNVIAGSFERELPAISQPLNAEFGQPALIELHGYELSAEELNAGDMLGLTLYWQARTGDIPQDYTVFVHLVDESNQIIAQGDGAPMAGARPTDTWHEQEVVVDSRQLSIGPDTISSEAALLVGLYDAENGQRLAAFQDGRRLANDQVPLQSLPIVE